MRRFALLLAVGMVLAACASGSAPDSSAATTTKESVETAEPVPDELVVMSHDSFAGGVTDETFAEFTRDTGIEVTVLPAGDAGSMVSQAILTRDNPVADVVFGVDDTFLSRALDAGLFQVYRSPASVDSVPGLDRNDRVTAIDFGDVCLNYDVSWFAERGMEPPTSLNQLTDPAYRDLLVVENPATSSPGLAFLLATVGRYGEDGWAAYWSSLVGNGVVVESDWDGAYYGTFTRYGGDRPLVVSYASSPPAEVIFSDPRPDTAPTGVMTDGCYRQVEFAGILAGTGYPQAAGKLIDFMLSPPFQAVIPLTWFVFPVNQKVDLPSEFVEYTTIPDDPVTVDPVVIDENRDRWIEEWTDLVLP